MKGGSKRPTLRGVALLGLVAFVLAFVVILQGCSGQTGPVTTPASGAPANLSLPADGSSGATVGKSDGDDDDDDDDDDKGSSSGTSSGSGTGTASAGTSTCDKCHPGKGRVPPLPSKHKPIESSKGVNLKITRSGRPPQARVLVATEREVAGYAVDDFARTAVLSVALHRVPATGGSPARLATARAALCGLDIADYPPGYYNRGFRFDLASLDPASRPRPGDRVYVTTSGSGGEAASEPREVR
ncbi:MAG: hypothetical protein HY815_04260 [Candidatus Riflebacteria bacterium]|nr:hypothetical protein [Candidatus Riflebacteria bacterium]